MPLFRRIGAWSMWTGADGPLTLAILISLLIPALPLIFGVGLAYELVRRLDAGHRLGTDVHWVLATGLVVAAIVAAAALVMRT